MWFQLLGEAENKYLPCPVEPMCCGHTGAIPVPQPSGTGCCERKVDVQGRRERHAPHLGKPWVPPGSQLVGSGLAADLQGGES